MHSEPGVGVRPNPSQEGRQAPAQAALADGAQLGIQTGDHTVPDGGGQHLQGTQSGASFRSILRSESLESHGCKL
jgi:hypothetical protein